MRTLTGEVVVRPFGPVAFRKDTIARAHDSHPSSIQMWAVDTHNDKGLLIPLQSISKLTDDKGESYRGHSLGSEGFSVTLPSASRANTSWKVPQKLSLGISCTTQDAMNHDNLCPGGLFLKASSTAAKL